MFQNNLLCILKNVACTCLLTFWGEEQKVQVLLQRNPAVAFLHLKKCFLLFYLYAVESFRTVPLNVLGLFFFIMATALALSNAIHSAIQPLV